MNIKYLKYLYVGLRATTKALVSVNDEKIVDEKHVDDSCYDPSIDDPMAHDVFPNIEEKFITKANRINFVLICSFDLDFRLPIKWTTLHNKYCCLAQGKLFLRNPKIQKPQSFFPRTISTKYQTLLISLWHRPYFRKFYCVQVLRYFFWKKYLY